MKTFAYDDHVCLWEKELRAWVPDRIFDAHVHLGPVDAMGKISPERLQETCTTFVSLEYELLLQVYAQVLGGKSIEGSIAFGFPFREVNYLAANRYIENLATKNPRVRGFIISNPHDTGQTIREFKDAEKRGFRFTGVKPYYDLVGKNIPRSNFHTRTDEFVPDDLLDFMNGEKLAMVLHTGLGGMGDPDCQKFVRRIGEKYPNICVFLAHMGRYTDPSEYLAFDETDLLDYPNIYVETSSATNPDVYRAFFRRKDRWPKLIFGSDFPFGLITGIEYSDAKAKALFLSRDNYAWTDLQNAERFADVRKTLTYNAYHTIQAVKTAVDELSLSPSENKALKEGIFCGNVQRALQRWCGVSTPAGK